MPSPPQQKVAATAARESARISWIIAAPTDQLTMSLLGEAIRFSNPRHALANEPELITSGDPDKQILRLHFKEKVRPNPIIKALRDMNLPVDRLWFETNSDSNRTTAGWFRVELSNDEKKPNIQTLKTFKPILSLPGDGPSLSEAESDDETDPPLRRLICSSFMEVQCGLERIHDRLRRIEARVNGIEARVNGMELLQIPQ